MYYSFERAAEILGVTPGDLNRLRESGSLRAFRDGAQWKFRKEDVENLLTQQIKNRSQGASAEGPADSDWLNETEEELPTMMADSASFESLVPEAVPDTFKIVANTDDDLVLDDEDGGNALDGDDSPHLVLHGGSSGVSLIDDEDGLKLSSGSGSGIALVDDGFFDTNGSNIGLGHEDVILGDASGSGLVLDGGSGLILGSVGVGNGNHGKESGDESGLSLLSDDEDIFSLSPTPEETAPTISLEKEKKGKREIPAEPDIFSLADEPKAEITEMGGTSVLGADGVEEDFQLAPIETGDEDSDSDSSSQVIALDDDSVFTTDDGEEEGGTYGVTNEGKPSAGRTASPDDLGMGLEGLGDLSGFDSPLADDTLSFDSASGGMPDFTSTDEGFGAFGAATGTGFSDTPNAPTGPGCSYAMGRGCAQEPNYSGMAVGLGLVPCILVLMIAGMGMYELVRNLWSWDQPFGLTGTILETVGGLIKLF